MRIDLRWGGGGDNNQIRALAHELVGLQPDIIVASSSAATAEPSLGRQPEVLRRSYRTIKSKQIYVRRLLILHKRLIVEALLGIALKRGE
jgi:hypothetical protein